MSINSPSCAARVHIPLPTLLFIAPVFHSGLFLVFWVWSLMGQLPQTPSSHPYPLSIQLKLYQAFIFSVPILFTIILFLLFYLFYLKRRGSSAFSSAPHMHPRSLNRATTTTTVLSLVNSTSIIFSYFSLHLMNFRFCPRSLNYLVDKYLISCTKILGKKRDMSHLILASTCSIVIAPLMLFWNLEPPPIPKGLMFHLPQIQIPNNPQFGVHPTCPQILLIVVNFNMNKFMSSSSSHLLWVS